MKIFNITFKAILGGLFVAGTLMSLPAGSQTRFERPDTTPDYARYTTSEECYVAMRRIAQKVERDQDFWRDTVRFEKESRLEHYPEEASHIGEMCLSKFSLDSIPLKETRYWARVFLMANRDDDADRIYMRKYLGADDSTRISIFMEQLDLYRNARPVRIDRVKNLLDMALTQIPNDSSLWLVGLYSLMMNIGNDVGNVEFSREMGTRLLDIYNSSKDKLENEEQRQIMKMLSYMATHLLATEALMDSLSVSTEAYIRLREEQARSFGISSLEEMGIPTGIRAPAITGEHWYQPAVGGEGYEKTEPLTRPLPGIPNLIVFLHGGCHEDAIFIIQGRENPGDGHCWSTYSMLRRFVADYPTLNITLVVNTHGNIGGSVPLEPREEADTLAKYFLGFHKLPVSLAVVKRPYFRLPGLDKRRIDTETENDMNYQLGMNKSFGEVGNAIIIDAEGRVVEVVDGVRQRATELKLREFLDALVKQGE